MKKLPLHEPLLHKNDLLALNKAFKSTWISGSGKYVDLLEKKIKKFTSTKYAVACNSGSAGIFLTLKALGIQNNDEVIVPTITFIATVNAVTQNNAEPIFMDCDDKFNLDTIKTLKFLNEQTVTKNKITYNKKTGKRIFALLIVHCFGLPADIEKISRSCKEKGIYLIEDAAESLGSKYLEGKYKNLHTGSIGTAGIVSFNANKIITGGGGGIVISNNKKLISKIRYLIHQAKNDSIKFIHNESGYNLSLSNLQCAMICSQLNRMNNILKKKKQIHNYYKNYLNPEKFELVNSDKKYLSNYWVNVIKVSKQKNKNFNLFMKKMIKKGILLRFVWYPNHLQKPFKKYYSYKIRKSLGLVKKSICLPSGLKLNKKNIKNICSIINSV
mgnify:CR=1 FL=1